MHPDDNEEKLLRSVALQNAQAVFRAREKAERALIEAKEALERKTSELAEQRESFRVTLSSIGDAVITTDIEARVTFLNPVGEAMTGWKLSEAVGQPLEKVFNIINEQTRRPVPSPVSKVLRDGAVVGLANHTALIARDGTETAIDDSAAPIRDVNGNILGVVMVFHDVSQRRRAETALRESNERTTNILESITDGFAVLDKQWRFTYLNKKAEDILQPLGKSRASLLGKSHWEEFPDLVGTELERNYRRAVSEQVKVEFELFYPPLDAWFGVRAYPSRDGLSVYFQDITDRKRAAEALRTTAERMHAIFNQAAVGIAMASLEGRFVEINQKFTDILGYSIDELRQMTFADITHPDDLARTQSGVSRLVAGEIADLVYEKRYVRKDGRPVWSLTTVTLLKDAEGKPQRFIGVIEDITQRKEVELEREQLTNVLERSLNEIYTFDTETLRFEIVNSGARRNLGYSLQEMRQKTPIDIKPEFTEASYRAMLKPLLSGEKEKHIFHTVHRRRDGTEYPVEVHLQPVTHAGQRVFLTVILDITERKKQEEKLRRSEEELRALANSIPQLAWMAEPDGHIFWYNHKWYEYTGTTFEQMEGWGWQTVHDPKMLPLVLERWKESIRTGQPFEMEFPLRGADGVFRWFLTRVNPVHDSQGRVVRWFGTNTNVDEVRRTREALRDAQEKLSRHAEDLEKQVAIRTASLREAISQLEEFSYTVSHDLRAPIRAITGYTQIFKADYGNAFPPEAHLFFEKISRSAARMESLVNDVLTISRVARAQIELHPIALQRFIEEIAEQHPEMQAPAADVSITAPHIVIADGSSLNQAISNLLANAVKFVHEHTKPVVTVRSEQNGDRVRIWVEDNGIGISSEHRSKLFGMFQRLPTARQYEGTGIGLAIVRKAVERMGGTVGIESNGTSGSRFWLELKGQQ